VELIAIIALSALVQIAAAFFALRLIRITGARIAWILIAGAFCVASLRRLISLWWIFSGGTSTPEDLVDESVALITSFLLLIGVIYIAPLFLTIKQAVAAQQRSKEELEVEVAERTAKLRDANTHLAVELDERRRAEQLLAHYAEDLKRSNAALEEFAYVASHDLQEPLRMVASFTQLLAKRYQGKLDRDADEFIGFAVDGATRMQQLIQALLAYSRVGTHGKPLAPTDCNVILGLARNNLLKAIEESRAEVTSGPLPTVPGDEVQLIQLFQNLIANALKFRGRAPPVIRISAQEDNGDWRFAFRDNGIGIAQAHQDRIFKIFQRLHRRPEYPGTGIGLAICKKIVERHGGRLWVESEEGRGATFFFTIPKENHSDQLYPSGIQAH
jgi:light-regulated signal transduction histidine kinase (bacteriophytochrome)